jgi:hypothetical protein
MPPAQNGGSLAGLYPAKRRLPTVFELDSDQAIVGIAGSVTAFRERGFIASLL